MNQTTGIIAKNALDAKKKATKNYESRGVVYYDFDRQEWGAVPAGTPVGHFESHQHIPHKCMYFRNDMTALQMESKLQEKRLGVPEEDE